MSNAWKVTQMLDAWSFDSRIQEVGADRVMKEAADEIEKLRAERDALRAALQHYADDDYNGFNADGAHARAALKGKGDE